MARSRFLITTTIIVAHPEGVTLTTNEVRMRVHRLLDESEAASQPEDFYILDARNVKVAKETD